MKLYYVSADIDVPFMHKLFDLALALNGQKYALWQYPNTAYSVSDDEEDVTESYVGESQELKDVLLEIKPFSLGVNELELITTYDDDTSPFKPAESYRIESGLIDALVNKHAILADSLDSIAVYREGNNKWLMGMIFHEKMTLLKDLSDDEIKILQESGVPYSETPPDCW